MGESQKKKKPPRKSIKSLHQFMQIIESKDLDGELKAELIKHISKYPEGALDQVYNNIHKVLQSCQAKITARRPYVEPAPVEEVVVHEPMKRPERAERPKQEPPKSKWSVASAAEIERIRNKPQDIGPIPMAFGSRPQKQTPMDDMGLGDVSKMTPEEATEFIKRKFAMEPPIEGSPKKDD